MAVDDVLERLDVGAPWFRHTYVIELSVYYTL